MPSFADLAAPTPLQRFVNHQIHTGSGWHKGLANQQEQLATHSQGGPACSVEDLMEEAPVAYRTVATSAQGSRNCATSLGQERSQRVRSSVSSTSER